MSPFPNGALALALLTASGAFSQAPGTNTQTLHVTSVPNPAALFEIATAVRTVGGVREVTADQAKFDIQVTGDDTTLAVAAWMVKQLDTPAPPAASGNYAIPGTSDVVRVVYTGHSPTQASKNELVTSLRSVGGITKVFTYSPLQAIVLRATAEQASLAEWMVRQLDVGLEDQTRWQRHEYPIPGADRLVKVVYLVHPVGQANLNEIVTTIRAVADIRMIFTRTEPPGIAFSTDQEHAHLADWLVQQLDVEPDGQMRAEKHTFPVAFATDETARVYYLSPSDGPAALRDVVQTIRAEVATPRMFACTAPRAVAIRGNADVIAAAERAIRKHDIAAAP